jgi:Leu/Phe-tRNA-protein transferase
LQEFFKAQLNGNCFPIFENILIFFVYDLDPFFLLLLENAHISRVLTKIQKKKSKSKKKLEFEFETNFF